MAASILVVDDDGNIRELLRMHLSAAGYDVHVAQDPISAGYMVPRSPPRLQRRIDARHPVPDLRRDGVSRSDLGSAHALATQRGEPRLRRFHAAKHAERHRPAVIAVILHDEVVPDAERPQLGGLFQRALPAALRPNEHPPAGRFLAAPLSQAGAERERLERLLDARSLRAMRARPSSTRFSM